MNGIFTLSLGDLWRGVVVSILAAVIAYALIALNVPGFSFLAIDYAEIARLALVAGLSYIGKNLLTTSSGNVLGIPTKT